MCFLRIFLILLTFFSSFSLFFSFRIGWSLYLIAVCNSPWVHPWCTLFFFYFFKINKYFCYLSRKKKKKTKVLIAFVQVTTDDLLQAAQMEERGMLDRKERSPETWKQVAINEAAMAVVAVNFPDLKNIEFVWSLNPSLFAIFWCIMCSSIYLRLFCSCV